MWVLKVNIFREHEMKIDVIIPMSFETRKINNFHFIYIDNSCVIWIDKSLFVYCCEKFFTFVTFSGEFKAVVDEL